MKNLAAALVALFLTGCTTGFLSGDQAYPNSKQLVGVYYWGDGLGANEVMELRKDGTYKQTLVAHLTSDDLDLYGRWQAKEKHIYFYKSDGTYPARPNRLTNAETFFYKGKPAFVREQDLKDGKVHQWWVYTWQHRPDA